MGVFIVVNKVLGIRVVLVRDVEIVKGICWWNDVNVLVMSLWVIFLAIVKEILVVWFME